MRYDGITRKVRLHTSSRDQAAEEALRLFEKLSDEGWQVIDARLARLPHSPSIAEYCEFYRKATERMESPPRAITVDNYLRHLRLICRFAGVSQLRELTPAAIERGRDAYRAKARKEGRRDSAIQNTLGMIIRDSSACFSSEARTILERQGLKVTNPFEGIKRTQRIEPVTALDKSVVSRIWEELPLLRDGDPDEDPPNRKKLNAAYARLHGHRLVKVGDTVKKVKRKPRWTAVDYTKPHREAYVAVLLGLGLGLRANEIDKARWSWIKFDEEGAPVLEVREEGDFKPKGGTLRVIRIPEELHQAIERTREDMASPYILGGGPSAVVEEKGFGYRMRDALRVANDWLRARGVEAGNPRGNALHRLRKQFGSEVATTHGLFAAQKYLGHSSPGVTSKFYATQINLPKLSHVRIVG